jgi:hypothetical protein
MFTKIRCSPSRDQALWMLNKRDRATTALSFFRLPSCHTETISAMTSTREKRLSNVHIVSVVSIFLLTAVNVRCALMRANDLPSLESLMDAAVRHSWLLGPEQLEISAFIFTGIPRDEVSAFRVWTNASNCCTCPTCIFRPAVRHPSASLMESIRGVPFDQMVATNRGLY